MHLFIPDWIAEPDHVRLTDIVLSLEQQYPHLQLIILFGSVARREARPSTDPDPSDIDLLCIFREKPALDDRQHIYTTIGDASRRHPASQTDLNILMAAPGDLEYWRLSLLANIIRDGIILLQRAGALLPPVLQPSARMADRPIATC